MSYGKQSTAEKNIIIVNSICWRGVTHIMVKFVLTFVKTRINSSKSESGNNMLFGALLRIYLIQISWENGCPVWPWRKCYACVPVPGLLPDSWDQLLLLCGHHGEGRLGSPKEEETKSIHSETKCQKKRRISEEESQCFNWKEVVVSRWTRSPFSGMYIVQCFYSLHSIQF